MPLVDGEGNPIPEQFETGEIIRKLSSDDPLEQAIGLRDYLIHELTVNRCPSCQASKLRTGDTAALVLRTKDTLETLVALRKQQALEDAANLGEVTGIAAIRGKRSTGGAETPNPSPSQHGSKNAVRRTSPHRRNARS